MNKTDAWRIHARAEHEEGRSLKRVRYIASREPADIPLRDKATSQCFSRLATNTLNVSNNNNNKHMHTKAQGYQASPSAQPTPLRESL